MTDTNPIPTQEEIKKTAVTPEQAHDADKYTDTLEETAQFGYYSEAEKLLKPIPYAKKNRKTYLFANIYASLYHIISFLLGLATVVLVAKMFITIDNTITFFFSLLIAIVLVAILGGLELFKGNASTDVFKAFAKEETPTNSAKVGMFGTFILSVIISSIGGGFLSLELNDKTASIQNTSQIESDSLKNLYNSQLEGYQMIIESNKKTLQKTKNKWLRLATNESLQKATAAKNEILDKLDNKLTTSQKLSETKILLADKDNLDLALLVGFIVFILECFCILAYRYKFFYLRNCEREGVNFGILQIKKNALNDRKNNDFDINDITKSINDLFKNLSTSIQNQANQTFVEPNKAYSRQKAGFQTYSEHEKQESKPNPIGFQFGKNENASENNAMSITQSVKRNALESGNRYCLHCEEPYTYKVNHQKFCSKKCRMEHWEEEKGTKLKFNKK